jgi:DNA-binding NarL/FixJ family response regulator
MGLVALVNTEADMEVVAEAADGAQAIELFAKCRPDLALLDTRMPVKDGIQATTEIRKRFPDASILMLTAFDGDADIRRALAAGVKGYVLKSSTGEDLIPALRAVFAGERWVSAEVATRLTALKTFEELTPREVEVLQHLSKGLANKQIAEALHITEYTVKDHLKNILAKLRVADRTEAVTVALRRGIIHL